MSNNEQFVAPTQDEWKQLLLKELKGQPLEAIEVSDSIENIHLKPNLTASGGEFAKSANNVLRTFGLLAYFKNELPVRVSSDSEANAYALDGLNLGADALRFIVHQEVDFERLMQKVEWSYIHTTFEVSNLQAIKSIAKHLTHKHKVAIALAVDPQDLTKDEIKEITVLTRDFSGFVFEINGFGCQQAGANVAQELAYVLNESNVLIAKLLELGLDIDKALAKIKISLGASGNYFYDLAKVRLMHALWWNLCDAYAPKHRCSLQANIVWKSGFMNRSLKDPHTNLLRLTTEAMAGIYGVIQQICCYPYDFYSTHATQLSKRMTVNIPTILTEESYAKRVFDPAGGSYTIDALVDRFGEMTYTLFQQMSSLSETESRAELKKQILQTRNLRVEKFLNGQTLLIGVNKYANPEEVENEWNNLPHFMGIEFLNFEKIALNHD